MATYALSGYKAIQIYNCSRWFRVCTYIHTYKSKEYRLSSLGNLVDEGQTNCSYM